jgi:hypothetical protein
VGVDDDLAEHHAGVVVNRGQQMPGRAAFTGIGASAAVLTEPSDYQQQGADSQRH